MTWVFVGAFVILGAILVLASGIAYRAKEPVFAILFAMIAGADLTCAVLTLAGVLET